MDKMKPFGRVFFKSSLINLRFAQKRGCVFVHYNELIINPSTYPHWERKKTNPNQESFLLLSLCTNSAHCFCAILCLEKRPSLIWTKWSLSGGCLSKVLWKTHVLHKSKFKFLCNVLFYRFLWFRWAVNLVTLNESETAVGNIITLLCAFHRSEVALWAAYESLKAWHQTVCCVSALPKRTFLTGNPARRCAVSLSAALSP